MKYLAPLLVIWSLIALTDPTGLRVWIAKEQVTAITPPTDCGLNARAKVRTGDTFLCVQETVEQARQLLW